MKMDTPRPLPTLYNQSMLNAERALKSDKPVSAARYYLKARKARISDLERATDKYRRLIIQKDIEFCAEQIQRLAPRPRRIIQDISPGPTRSSTLPSRKEDESATDGNYGFAPTEPRYTFADVSGLADVKKEIEMQIIAPLKDSETYYSFLEKDSAGIGLAGPPGCGKTYIAEAAAGESGVSFFMAGKDDLMNKYYGETQRKIGNFFKTLAENEPCIGFIDEFDAIAGRRTGGRYKISDETVNSLLESFKYIDGKNVLFVYATNRPWDVDSAFRTGRVDRKIIVPPPDLEARIGTFRIQMGKRVKAKKTSVDLNELAGFTGGYSNSDIRMICKKAGQIAYEDFRAGNRNKKVVKHLDFLKAIREQPSSLAQWATDTKSELVDNRYSDGRLKSGIDEQYRELLGMADTIHEQMASRNG